MNYPTEAGFYMPAEWHKKQRTFMEWPVRKTAWKNLFPEAQKAYANVANKISEFEPLSMIVSKELENKARKLCSSTIDIISLEHDDSWMRDNGPTFVINDKKEIAGISWQFNAWGNKYIPYENDAKVATNLLNLLNIKNFKSNIILEGGSIHVDGLGTLITTEECLLNPNRNPSLSKTEIEDVLMKYLGIKKIIWLKKGLFGDETDGHIDNVATFVKPHVIAIQSCNDINDPNYSIYKENLNILENATDALGKKFEIISIPQPPITYYNNERLTLSYINYYLVNGGVILPVFGDSAQKTDKIAVGILQELYPNRNIIQVDGSFIIRGGGNIHCITQQMPHI